MIARRRALVVLTSWLMLSCSTAMAVHCYVYHRGPHAGHRSYYPGRGYAAAQQGATSEAQRLWAEQAAMAMSQTRTAANRLQSAEQAWKEGNPRLAGYLLVRVGAASSQIPGQVSGAARQALFQLRSEAMNKLAAVEERLGVSLDLPDSSPSLATATKKDNGQSLIPPELRRVARQSDRPPADDSKPPASSDEEVIAAFHDLEKLAHDYGTVPVVNHLLATRLHHLQHQPEFAAILRQPEADTLLKEGVQYEGRDERCCAYLSYEAAAQLKPAPAAIEAQKSFDRLAADPKVVSGAETCRNIRECHELYHRAELLIKEDVARDKAEQLLKQILGESPADSAIHVAARQALAKLDGNDE